MNMRQSLIHLTHACGIQVGWVRANTALMVSGVSAQISCLDEDCSHPLFKCSFGWMIWASQKISWVDVTSEEAFWGFPRGGIYKRKAEEGKLFVVLCTI